MIEATPAAVDWIGAVPGFAGSRAATGPPRRPVAGPSPKWERLVRAGRDECSGDGLLKAAGSGDVRRAGGNGIEDDVAEVAAETTAPRRSRPSTWPAPRTPVQRVRSNTFRCPRRSGPEPGFADSAAWESRSDRDGFPRDKEVVQSRSSNSDSRPCIPPDALQQAARAGGGQAM